MTCKNDQPIGPLQVPDAVPGLALAAVGRAPIA
jgi:hypothetical protein